MTKAEAKAFDEGARAGRLGDPFENPYSATNQSPGHRFKAKRAAAWRQGYRIGLAERKSSPGPDSRTRGA